MYNELVHVHVHVGWSSMDLGGSLQHRDQPGTLWELGDDRGGGPDYHQDRHHHTELWM